MEGVIALYIVMLAAFTGYEIIASVPVILHTPLMSGSNFVHGIVLVGAMVALGRADTAARAGDRLHRRRARRRQRGRRLRRHRAHAADVQGQRPEEEEGVRLMSGLLPENVATLAIDFSYLLVAFLFIMGLKAMSSPVTARRGIVVAGFGMLIGTLMSFLYPGMGNFPLMLAAIAIGGGLAWWSGRIVAMTDMPQMIALYNGMGGGAAAAIAAVELLRMASADPARRRDARPGRDRARGGRRLHRRGQLLGLADRLRQAPGAHQAQLPLQGPAVRQPR